MNCQYVCPSLSKRLSFSQKENIFYYKHIYLQLISKSKKNEENKKYVIRFRKEDKEEAEIVEVDNNKVVEDNVEDDKQIEDNQSQTAYRRRRAT